MSETENVLRLLEEIRKMICNLSEEGDRFDLLKVRIALEMAKHELEKAFFPENSEAD